MKISWLINVVLLAWIAVHAIPALNVDTRFYPPAAVLPDGSHYYGDMVGDVFHGEGKLLWPNGDHYIGDFANGMIHGEGSVYYASGDRQQGRFAKGYAEGSGEYRFASGDVFHGDFAQDYFHGPGRLEFANGAHYQGNFKRGYFDGEGEIHYADGQVFSGIFVTGDIVRGQHWDARGTIYEGGFLMGLYHGEGTLRYGSGDVYQGQFDKGMIVGGTHIGPDGSRYDGEFLDYNYHGQGKYTDASGYTYEGGFEYGMYHGQGVMTYIDENGQRQVHEGTWELGGVNQSTAQVPTETFHAETVLYNQPALLDRVSENLEANDPGAIDLYFLGIAGDGSQDVFLNEIRFIQDKLEALYSLEGKSALLVNHVDTKDTYPLATQWSIAKTLERIAAQMDPEEDILMLYLTSHGSETHDFYIHDRRVSLDDVSAEALASMINQLPVKWRVVMISACYSGGFIPHLKNAFTMVMTAARADRPSFGCGNDSDMTYFGKALFKESLSAEKSWIESFDDALEHIEKWEQEDAVDQHSEPQIFVGEQIAEHLERWHHQQSKK